MAFTAITILAFLPNYDNLPDIVSFSDLLNHTLAFTTLAVLLQKAYTSLPYSKIVVRLAFYAVGIEVVQNFLPTRVASLSDIAADVTGLLLAFIILRVPLKLWRT